MDLLLKGCDAVEGGNVKKVTTIKDRAYELLLLLFLKVYIFIF